MNFLIVDDNKSNRMILRLLIEAYMEENENIDFKVDEAVDGLEAVKMCQAKNYNMVLMDMMMPNMDGIEATKLIRKNDKKIMIIAVSTVDDALRKKEIFISGAEDYIAKPVDADIFNARISNYIHIISSRDSTTESKKVYTQSINLFTKETYSRYTNFSLATEDALLELWEYYLLDVSEKIDSLSDVVRTVFSIAEKQIELCVESGLYVEEDEEYKYFTVTNIDKVPPEILQLLLQKNEVRCQYKIEQDKISFKLVKILIPLDVEEQVSIIQTPENSPSFDYTSSELEVYNYIDPDDMLDLEEYVGKLSSLMLIVSSNITENEAIEIYTYIEKIGIILSTYSEVSQISFALTDLATTISTEIDTFMQNSELLAPMCRAFSKDLMKWMEMSFYTGAPSEDFMNDTIAVNCQTIASMISMNNASEVSEELDDIFDF